MAVGDPWERPEWLPDPEWTPAEEWGRIVGRQAPFWEARRPMTQLGQRLQGRYLLGAPAMSQAWMGADEPTFADYASGFTGGTAGGWQAGTYADLLARARLAEAATRAPIGEYLDEFAPKTDAYNQAAWYAAMFNPQGSSDRIAAANQLQAATLLAQQRRGDRGGAYTGAMGRAIAQAVAAQQQYRQDIGKPKGSFLSWYLDEMGAAPASGTAASGTDSDLAAYQAQTQSAKSAATTALIEQNPDWGALEIAEALAKLGY
ncbi:hypothetical protein CMI37_26010 [Candidatus Pacearchaeota archaeon]|nr:hypothetical protein [Candidatus Pacearchaeota archaeon]